jgi:5-formyltetrahydrofolate cyclo-ligase
MQLTERWRRALAGIGPSGDAMRGAAVNVVHNPSATADGESARRLLRARLLKERNAFGASRLSDAASAALGHHLRDALSGFEATSLGLYWPLGSEFDVAGALAADSIWAKVTHALPYARRSSREMEFRRWDGGAPALVDECGIACSDGPKVLPDVVVAPCVGFTAAGHRLGYGGGYYDRWLAANPQVVAVGLAWSFAELDVETFAARWHDIPLRLVVTERGVR